MFADNSPSTEAVSAQTTEMITTKRVLERIFQLFRNSSRSSKKNHEKL